MKHYKELLKKGCFDRKYIETLTGGEAAAGSIIFDYLRLGLIKRVRRDLYIALDLASELPTVNRYVVGSNISETSYVTHHSALEYHGFQNQGSYIMYVAADRYFTPFEFEDTQYVYVKPKISEGVLTENKVRVTDWERTVLDCINELDKSGGLEELLRSIHLIPSLDESKVLRYLDLYGKVFLYQKAGFVLEFFKEEFNLSKNFFDTCKRKLSGSKRYFQNDAIGELYYNSDWNLYVPMLEEILTQGISADAAEI